MDQQISNELPPVQPSARSEQAGFNANTSEALAGPSNAEAQNAVAIERGRSVSHPPLPQIQQPPQMMAFADPAPGPAAVPQVAGMPAIADDTDLIEKEWVVKAKEIVARTKHDPYQQNKEVERVKAEYLKIRYNKEIKLTED